MTTLQQIELRCPICDTRFKSQQVISTNSFGGKRTDFHERAAGTQPLPYLIHMCNRCGYSGAERDFTEEAEVSPGLREHGRTANPGGLASMTYRQFARDVIGLCRGVKQSLVRLIGHRYHTASVAPAIRRPHR